MGCPSWAWGNATTSCAKSIPGDGIGTYRTGYVFKCLLTQINEPEFELIPDLLISRRRDADAARLGYALKPRCDVDTIPEDVVALDQDVPEIDPDPELHPAINGHSFVPFSHHRLYGDRTFDRIDY